MINFDDPTVKKIADEIEYDDYEYIRNFFGQIRDLDIVNFDFETFKFHIEGLDEKSFQYIWDNYALPTLRYVDETYIPLEIDQLESLELVAAKKKFLTNFINFLMEEFPYDILFQYVIPSDIASLNDLRAYLDEHEDDLKEKILEESSHRNAQVKMTRDIIKMYVDDIKKRSVKESYERRFNYTDSVIKNILTYNEVFISFVMQAPMENLKNTIIKYAVSILEK